jgi:hypothetical protein
VVEGGAAALDFLDDRCGGGVPDEGSRVVAVPCPGRDRVLELGDVGEGPASQPSIGEFSAGIVEWERIIAGVWPAVLDEVDPVARLQPERDPVRAVTPGTGVFHFTRSVRAGSMRKIADRNSRISSRLEWTNWQPTG